MTALRTAKVGMTEIQLVAARFLLDWDMIFKLDNLHHELFRRPIRQIPRLGPVSYAHLNRLLRINTVRDLR